MRSPDFLDPPGFGGREQKYVPDDRQPQVCGYELEARVLPFLSDPSRAPVLAYLLAWLTTVSETPVSDANSVVPAWVRHQHPTLPALVKQLRDTPCPPPGCPYCQRAHDLEAGLEAYFGFPSFRPDPDHPETSLQREITSSLARGDDLLAILPTGGGKSVCFQLPALMWAARGKRLTIVISPLQSLMKDQVDVLRQRHGIPNVAALYGGLNPLERHQVLNGVSLGDYDLLYVAPEQLRNLSFRAVISRREIAAWVIDEAHCLSKWGHDFRPDYLYIGRFIRELTLELKLAPPTIACFTATAKPEVIEEICDHFRQNLDRSLTRFEGSHRRENLSFLVVEAPAKAKLAHCVELLEQHIREDGSGGTAVVYAASRAGTESLAEALQAQGWRAEFYHAGRKEEKRAIQDQFIRGELPVIVATNAFGMGVDKEDVRLVIHADIPGSLEAYLQEAGRAGRDRKPALCVLLYDPQDVDSQFRLQGRNRISLRDIQEILKGIRARQRKTKGEEISVTSGELLREEISPEIDLEDHQYDTKVKTAILMLEQGQFVERNHNRFSVFQGKLRFEDLFEVQKAIETLKLPPQRAQECHEVCRVLLGSSDDQLLNTDVLSDQTGIAPEELLRVMKILRDAGLVTLSLQLTATLTLGSQADSLHRLKKLDNLERALVDVLQSSPDLPPDAGPDGHPLELNLRRLCSELKAREIDTVPADIRPILLSFRNDRKLSLARRGNDRYAATLRTTLPELKTHSSHRLAVARVVLETMVTPLREAGLQGAHAASFTLAELEQGLRGDLLTRVLGDLEERAKAALLFLHDQHIIVLQGGLTVLRPAMTLRIKEGGRVTKAHYEPLESLYRSQVAHIHVMDRYAQLGTRDVDKALEFVDDYFRMDESGFLAQHFKGELESVARPTSARSYFRIVEALKDRTQQEIVTSKARSLLVLAGPGSGKTRVVVHRVAYLLEVERVPPEQVLVLAFNRSAARVARRRVCALLGPVGRAVAVYTYHSLALSLIGMDLSEPEARKRLAADDEKALQTLFDGLLDQAAEVLEGRRGLLAGYGETESWHQRLFGWRYIFVDEYQDVNKAQYRLIRALTGLHLEDREDRLTIMAVGDDDQSIYAFTGARVEYLRRFEADYQARQKHLVVNFRSTPAIVAASGALIALNRERMKEGIPLTSGRVDGKRGPARSGREASIRSGEGPSARSSTGDPARSGKEPSARSGTGGPAHSFPRVGVHRVANAVEAARLAVELLKQATSSEKSPSGKPAPSLDAALPSQWNQLAVLTRFHRQLAVLEVLLRREGIPAHPLARDQLPFYRLRQVRRVLDQLTRDPTRLYMGTELRDLVLGTYGGAPLDDVGVELLSLVDDWEAEVGGKAATARSFSESLFDRGKDVRTGDRNQLVLSTLHGAKGLEFDTVVLLACPSEYEGWGGKDADEERRLFYVGMTRARDRLHLIDQRDSPSPSVQEVIRHAPKDYLEVDGSPVALKPGDGDLEGLEVLELKLKHLWLSYPARGAGGLPGVVVSRLEAGDSLELRVAPGTGEQPRVSIRAEGVEVGRTSIEGSALFLNPDGSWKVEVREAVVSAVVVMDRREGGDEPVDRWEVVVPRIVFRNLKWEV